MYCLKHVYEERGHFISKLYDNFKRQEYAPANLLCLEPWLLDEDTTHITLYFINMFVMLLLAFYYATMHIFLINSNFKSVSINFPSVKHIQDTISSQIIDDK